MPLGTLPRTFHVAQTGRKTVHFTRGHFPSTPRNLDRYAMSLSTLNDIFFSAIERNQDRIMLYREGGKWVPISSRQFGQMVARTTHALHDWGIRPGDRVAILSENRPEWPTADMATLALKAVTVPLYTTLTAEQNAFVLKDSGCRVLFLSSDQHLQKILPILS
jgi:long-chain acyl-CoA synthetase